MKFLSLFLVTICGLVVNCHPAGPEEGSSSAASAPVQGIRFNCRIWEGNYFQQTPVEVFTRAAITVGIETAFSSSAEKIPSIRRTWSIWTSTVPDLVRGCQSRYHDDPDPKWRVDTASYISKANSYHLNGSLRVLVVLHLSDQGSADEGVDMLGDARTETANCIDKELKTLFAGLSSNHWISPTGGCGTVMDGGHWFGMLANRPQ